MTSHEPRRAVSQSVPADTLRAIRTALAHCLMSAPDKDVSALFREARLAAQRDQVAPDQLVEVIMSSWYELAEATGMPAERRADELSAALTRCLEAILDADD